MAKKGSPKKESNRKTTRRKTTTTNPDVKNERISVSKLSKKNKILLLLILILLIFSGLLYLGKSLFVAAVVKGKPITRLEVVKELEKTHGKEILENLVTKKLIYEEARLQGVIVTNEIVQSEIDKISKAVEAQGTTLDSALSFQRQTRSDLEENIRIQKTLEQILKSELELNEDEVKKYFEENKELYGKDVKYEDLKDTVRDQLKQTKLSEKFGEWIQKQKDGSQIIYFVNY